MVNTTAAPTAGNQPKSEAACETVGEASEAMIESSESTAIVLSADAGTTDTMVNAAAALTAGNPPKSEATCESVGEAAEAVLESSDSTVMALSAHIGATDVMVTAAAAPTAGNQPKSEATCETIGEVASEAMERGEQTATRTDREKSGSMQKMLQEAFQAVERGVQKTGVDREKSGGMQKMLQEAFPADKMQNSIGVAKSLASWGFGKVVEGATKVSDKVAEVDFAQEAHKIAQKTDHAMQKGVQEVRSLPGQRAKVRDMVDAIEQRMQVSTITGAASTKARAFGQDLQPGLEKTAAAFQPGLERTAQAAELAKEKAGEFAEQMKPRIMEVHENAKKKIRKAASKAAATAAWFQTKQHTANEASFSATLQEDAAEDRKASDASSGASGSNDLKELILYDTVMALSNSRHCETLSNQEDAKASEKEAAQEGEEVSKEAASVTEQGDAEALGQETKDVVAASIVKECEVLREEAASVSIPTYDNVLDESTEQGDAEAFAQETVQGAAASEFSEKTPRHVLVEHTDADNVFEQSSQQEHEHATDQAANTGCETVNSSAVPATAVSEDARESAADVVVDNHKLSAMLTEDATDIGVGASRKVMNELLTPANAALVEESEETNASEMVTT